MDDNIKFKLKDFFKLLKENLTLQGTGKKIKFFNKHDTPALNALTEELKVVTSKNPFIDKFAKPQKIAKVVGAMFKLGM